MYRASGRLPRERNSRSWQVRPQWVHLRCFMGFVHVISLSTVAGTQMEVVHGIQDPFLRPLVASQAADAVEAHGARRRPIVFSEAQSLQDLIICNAYANISGLHVYDLNTHKRLTGEYPLMYKACANMKVDLHEGDKLDFRSGDLSVGVFRATSLPKSRASLLLVPHRRHQNTISASFDSHTFGDWGLSQIVLIDAYNGKRHGKVTIVDDVQSSAYDRAELPQHAESLNYKSVISVNPGHYRILLEDETDKSVADMPLEVRANGGKYIVMRAGNEPDTNNLSPKVAAFPEELVVYSRSAAQASTRFDALVATVAIMCALASRI